MKSKGNWAKGNIQNSAAFPNTNNNLKKLLDFPGGRVVKNLPANAGFDTWSRNIPHATEKLSLWAAITEVRYLVQEYSTCHRVTKPLSCNYRGHSSELMKRMSSHALQHEEPPQWEAFRPQLESRPHSLQLEKARMQQWGPSTAKNK